MKQYKNPSATGWLFIIAAVLAFIVFSAITGYNVQNTKPQTSKPQVEKSQHTLSAVEQSRWCEPRIYPGVKLYYRVNSQSPMVFVGTVVDAVGHRIDGERTFSIRYANSDNEEYKYRRILWNGHWYADRKQQQQIVDSGNW